ncbi:MAG: hypothetical protein A2Y15_00865 [Clostridiales bacterium GWF2_36_10]|nr:MAG: hypothetical protein A2Y15_00865 [Clostridiales bacterium GWF2_36_10]
MNPKQVDKENKYRHYDNEQIIELNKILALKEAGMTLSEIKKINKQQIPKEVLIKLLCGKLFEAKKALINTHTRRSKLQSHIKHLKYEEDKIMKINLDELSLGSILKSSFELRQDELRIQLSGDNECFLTPCEYTLPLQIKLKAMTDSTNIRLYYALGEVILNWECMLDELRVHDVKNGRPYGFPGKGNIPVNEYIDITWVIKKEGMELFVNGIERLNSSDFPYAAAIKQNPALKFSSTVGVGSAWGSTVTIRELDIKEL